MADTPTTAGAGERLFLVRTAGWNTVAYILRAASLADSVQRLIERGDLASSATFAGVSIPHELGHALLEHGLAILSTEAGER